MLKATGWRPRMGASEGFSLVELLVSILVAAQIMAGVTMLFTSSAKLARSQTHVAELQQNLRIGQSEIVRFARMAGIGGLPITRLNLPEEPAAEPDGDDPNYDLLGAFPRSGYAVSVLNNVGEGTIIQVVNPDSTADAENVVPGSDVLIVRGVLTTPLYYFDPPLDVSNWLDTLPVEDKEVVVPDRIRIVGRDWEDYPQDIAALGARLLAAKSSCPPASDRSAFSRSSVSSYAPSTRSPAIAVPA